jgi:hypothetical protein
LIELPFDGVGNFVLGNAMVEAAKCTFHFAQVAQFFAQGHIALSN